MAQDVAWSAGRRRAFKYRSHRSPDGKGRQACVSWQWPARDKLTRHSDPFGTRRPHRQDPRREDPEALLSADLHLLESLARE
jgi:hypothetical protein